MSHKWTLVNEKEFRITTGLVLFVQMILVNIKSVFCHLHNSKSLFTFYKRLDSDCPSQTKEKNLECATFGINPLGNFLDRCTGKLIQSSFNPYLQISGTFLRPFYWKTHPIVNWKILGRHSARFTGKLIRFLRNRRRTNEFSIFLCELSMICQ